jgi:hypothetical protein
LGTLSLAIVQGSAWGWGSGTIIWLAAAAATALFLLLNRRAKAPVINLALFRSRVFSSANTGMILLSASIVMSILGMSLYLQQGWHWSPIQTGLAIAPGPVFLFVTSQSLSRLRTPMSTAAMTVTGFVLLGAGEAVFTLSVHLLPGSHDYALVVLPGWILTGIGAGFSLPTLTGSATVGLPTHESAVGSAVIQVSRQLGTALGTATLTALLGSAIATGSTPQFLRAWWIAVAVSAVGGISALGLRQRKLDKQIMRPPGDRVGYGPTGPIPSPLWTQRSNMMRSPGGAAPAPVPRAPRRSWSAVSASCWSGSTSPRSTSRCPPWATTSTLTLPACPGSLTPIR